MVDELHREQTIHGKPVRVVLIFDDYPEKLYKADFVEFLEYQQKESLDGEKGETDWSFLKGTDLRPIPYEEFRKSSLEFFSKVIFDIVGKDPSLIVSDQLTLQMKIIRVPGRSYYFEYQHKGYVTTESNSSDEENACFVGAGIWFIQTIVAPWAYTKRINYSHILRYFLHELTHFWDDVQAIPLTQWDHYEQKIKKLARRKSAYCLNHFYNALLSLRIEGIAEFKARTNTPVNAIDMQGAKAFNKNLRKLVALRTKKESEEFYVSKIGYENLTPIGAYANGRSICLTIAIALARGRSLNVTRVGLFSSKQYFGPHIDIGKVIRGAKRVEVSGLTEEDFSNALAEIAKTHHYYFLKLYERACDTLGIEEQDRIMTAKRFWRLRQDAIAHARAVRRARLRKGGFVDLTTDTKDL